MGSQLTGKGAPERTPGPENRRSTKPCVALKRQGQSSRAYGPVESDQCRQARRPSPAQRGTADPSGARLHGQAKQHLSTTVPRACGQMRTDAPKRLAVCVPTTAVRWLRIVKSPEAVSPVAGSNMISRTLVTGIQLSAKRGARLFGPVVRLSKVDRQGKHAWHNAAPTLTSPNRHPAFAS
jgi:hypothetical protein